MEDVFENVAWLCEADPVRFGVISTLQNFTGLKVPREESISSYAVEPRPCYLSEDVQDYKR